MSRRTLGRASEERKEMSSMGTVTRRPRGRLGRGAPSGARAQNRFVWIAAVSACLLQACGADDKVLTPDSENDASQTGDASGEPSGSLDGGSAGSDDAGNGGAFEGGT